MELPTGTMAFIVRVALERAEFAGTVERVRTGEKYRFSGADRLGALIARMVAESLPQRGMPPPRPEDADASESRT